jgi:hypothetical protein
LLSVRWRVRQGARAASGPDRVTARRATRVCQLLGARQKITQQLKRVLTSQV